MSELNTNCKHKKNNLFGNFCIKCGAIYMHTSNDINTYTIKIKRFNFSPSIPPLEIFTHVEKLIAYQTCYKYNKTKISDFYKKARINCVKYIKLLIETYKASHRTYFLAINYLDLIYLNYDYNTIMKDFKSELISLGCFLVASKQIYYN